MKRKTIEDMHKLAAKKGGKCLSTEYINDRTKLEWECKCGNQWSATPDGVQQGCWCPECGYKQRAEKLRSSIEDMHDLAAKKGGKCLSTEYINTKTHLEWECADGHKWPAAPGNVQQGYWCPECVGLKRKTIEGMHDLAAKKGGKCLSTEYINTKTHLEWECKYKHKWPAIPCSVQRGRWCPECAKKHRCETRYGRRSNQGG